MKNIERELKTYMAYHGVTQKELSDLIGVTPKTFNYKLRGVDNAVFTINEARLIVHRLAIPLEKAVEIFFNSEQ